MRLKKNKDAKAKQSNENIQPSDNRAGTIQTTQTNRAEQNQRSPNSVNPGNDKVFGKDAKGRTIYEGPRGGHYYINSKGNKEYIKKG
jgi:colicin import membrane protein